MFLNSTCLCSFCFVTFCQHFFLNASVAAAHQQRAAEIYLIHDILQMTHAGDHSEGGNKREGIQGWGAEGQHVISSVRFLQDGK